MRLLHALIAVLTAVFVVVVGLPLAGPVAPASAASGGSTSSTAAGDVTLAVSPADDGVLVPGRDLVLDLTVTNTTETDVAEAVGRVYLDRAAFTTRSKLASWLSPDATSVSDYLGSYLARVDVPAVAAGSTQVVTLTVPAAQVALDGYAWGARALGARVVDADGAEVAQDRTSVVWHPGDSVPPTRLAVAVPITTPETETGVLDAGALAAYTSSDGTLTRQLRAVQGTRAAVGVDPMIIASIRLLGTAAPASALDWLSQLQASGLETFPLAYADADVAALSQAGAGTIPAPTSFDPLVDESLFAEPDETEPTPSDDATPTGEATPSGGATTSGSDAQAPGSDGTGGADPVDPAATDPAGQAPGPGSEPGDDPAAPPLPTTESLLDWPYDVTGVAWPTRASVVSSDLDAFTAGGYTTTVLSSSNVDGSTDATENAAVDLGDAAGVVSDDTLSTLVRRAAGAQDDAAWGAAMAELSASVATATRERPSDARTLLTTLDRGWSAEGGYLHETLVALAALPWATTASLADAVDSTPTAATVVDQPEDDERVAQVRSLIEADRRVLDLASALEQPQVVTAAARLRTLALASHAWRDNADGFASEVAAATAESTATAGLVSVVRGSDQLILGDRSSLPLYVQNATDSTATVYLTVQPSNPILAVEENRIEVTVQGQSQSRVRVPVQSVANGTVLVSMTLTSPTGVAIGTPSSVSINVQAGWETAITWVFAVGFVLLFGGGIYRTFRKRRRARDGGDGDDGDDDPRDHTPGDGDGTTSTTTDRSSSPEAPIHPRHPSTSTTPSTSTPSSTPAPGETA